MGTNRRIETPCYKYTNLYLRDIIKKSKDLFICINCPQALVITEVFNTLPKGKEEKTYFLKIV